MYGTVQELRSTFSHIKSIYIDFSLVWFLNLFVDLSLVKVDVTNTHTHTKKPNYFQRIF